MADSVEQQNFIQLLKNLSNPENELRSQAEAAYEGISIESKPAFLLQTLTSPCEESVKEMASILLRKLFVNNFEEFYPKLSPEVQSQLRSQVLLCVQNDSSKNLRKKFGDAAAELARNLIDDDGNNNWPEFLKFLFDSSSSSNADLKESALLMFASVPGIFGNQQSHYIDVIKQMLLLSIQDQTSPNVRFAAVKAITSFLSANESEKSIHRHFVECLPFMIQAIPDSLQSIQDDAVLKSLVELADGCPHFFRAQIDNLFQILLKIISDKNLDDDWRQLCVEFIVTLSENAAAMVRKTSVKYIPTFVSQLLEMMVDVDDEPDWSIQDEVYDSDNESNSTVAETALDRMACALGGKCILPHIVSSIPQMMANVDWKQRQAALMAISAVGEGCHKQMEGILTQIVDGILPFLHDQHPRVRYSACNALGQMSTDFMPIFEKKFHEKVVPGLLMVLDDNNNPRVQGHAAAALVNFTQDCPKSILAKYLDVIIAKLEVILSAKFKELVEKGTKLVLEQVLTTIATVADTSEEKFVDYYDRFMPCLKYILQHATSPELKLLRGKTIECISLIGLAVGKDKFLPDASEVMDMLLKAQTHETEIADDDPQLSYMISAWARICKILGKEFRPYLPLVMGLVMKAASIKPEVAILDSDEMPETEDDDWQFVNLGDQQNFGIKTAGLEEKATACQMLVCYARELKESFSDYTEEVVKLMVSLLNFYFHDSVRIAAAESLPLLLECAKIKGHNYLLDMWNFMCPELLKAVDTEPENEVLTEQMQSLAKCIEVLGKGCLSEQHMSDLLKFLDRLLKDHFEKAADRQAKRKDEDYDEQVEEVLVDEDDEDVYILSKICDVNHAIFAAYKEEFFPYFDRLLPHFVRLLAPDRSWSDHQWGICIFDDVIEHGGQACVKYQDCFLHSMVNSITCKNSEVRQAAAYGIGVLAQFGGDAFSRTCAECIPRLIEIISDPESRTPENANATENAISAITKILKYNSSCVGNVDEILHHWLAWLPVTEDTEEAVHIYNYLCDLIESNNAVILGNNNCNLPRVVAVIAEAFAEDVLKENPEVIQRLVNIVRQVQANGDVFTACLSLLNNKQQQALHKQLISC